MTVRIMAPALLLALTGCGLPANVVVLFPDENGAVGKVTVHEGDTPPNSQTACRGQRRIGSRPPQRLYRRIRCRLGVRRRSRRRATGAVVYLLYFQAGSTELDPGSRGGLRSNRCGKRHGQCRYQHGRPCRRDRIGRL